MLTQDDLIALFQEQLSLHGKIIQNSIKEEVKVEQPTFYSISQHYHHSTHVVQDPPLEVSEAPSKEQTNTQVVLQNSDVCLSSLSQSQIQLFKAADANQQKRLIELWRIFCPSIKFNIPVQNIWQDNFCPSLAESSDNMQCEEQVTEDSRLEADGDYCMEDDTMADSKAMIPYCPIQNENGQWRRDNFIELHKLDTFTSYEFERLSASGTYVADFVGGISPYTHSTDPVYNRIG